MGMFKRQRIIFHEMIAFMSMMMPSYGQDWHFDLYFRFFYESKSWPIWRDLVAISMQLQQQQLFSL